MIDQSSLMSRKLQNQKIIFISDKKSTLILWIHGIRIDYLNTNSSRTAFKCLLITTKGFGHKLHIKNV